MAILLLEKDDAPALKAKAFPVEDVTDEVRRLARDMLDTMYANGGCGLAANQVNSLQRVIVVDLSERHNSPMVMINPEITKARGTQTRLEGCLSYPGRKVKVTRAAKLTVKYLDDQGTPCSLKASSLFAQAVQHEIDHLNGICAVGIGPREVTRIPVIEKAA